MATARSAARSLRRRRRRPGLLARQWKGLKRRVRQNGPHLQLERFLSRRCYGNECGFINNLHGPIVIRRAARAGAYTAGCPWPEVVAEFQDRGFAVLPFRLDVAAVRARYEAQIDDPVLARNRTRYSRMIVAPERSLPEAEAVLNGPVRQLFQAHYGAHFYVWSFHAYRTYAVSEDVRRAAGQVYSDRWHFDWRSTAQARLFIALSDIGEDDGPFMIHTRRRSIELVRAGVWRGRKGHDEAAIDEGAFRLVGPSGAAIMCNTTVCLHRAGIPAAGRQRDLLTYQFMPAATELPAAWLRSFVQQP